MIYTLTTGKGINCLLCVTDEWTEQATKILEIITYVVTHVKTMIIITILISTSAIPSKIIIATQKKKPA